MSPNDASAVPGEIVAGRYRIEAWVGQGNMAMVFHATHLGTGRACALKLVHALLVERPEIQEMFVQEARVGGRIGKNPYIVDVFDAGIDSDRSVPFLTMDLLEGTTLDKYIKQHGPMSPSLLRTLWQQLADALEQAHAAGVVHRDLKPGNLFLTYDRKGNPQIRIVDFGIAKLMEEGVQRTATQIGTPAYAAPEQLGNGMRMMAQRMGFTVASTISPATDIWALGVITYEMLTGAPAGQLWTGSERCAIADLMLLVATEPTPTASVSAGARRALLPHGFDAWIERCLQKNAADRWPSVDVAVQNLDSLFEPGNNRQPGNNRLDTIRLPPDVLAAAARANAPKATLRLPPIGEANSDHAPSLAGASPSFAETSPPARGQFDSLTGSNPSPPREPRLDSTSLEVSGTLAPRRAKHARRVGGAIVGAIMSVAVLVLVVAVFMSMKSGANNATVSQVPSANSAAPSATPPISERVQKTDGDDMPGPTVTPIPTDTAEQGPPLVNSAAPDAGTPRIPNPAVAAASPAPTDGEAKLSINSLPQSKIVLDGKPIGNTPKIGISVSPGRHTIMLVHAEKGKKTEVVTVKAGERKVVAIRF